MVCNSETVEKDKAVYLLVRRLHSFIVDYDIKCAFPRHSDCSALYYDIIRGYTLGDVFDLHNQKKCGFRRIEKSIL